MSGNADTSNTARIQRIKARTIANDRRLNPLAAASLSNTIRDASIQNDYREGSIPYYMPTGTQSRTLLQDCCGKPTCTEPPGQVSNVTADNWNYTNNLFYTTIYWSAAPGATSYRVTTSSPGCTVYSYTSSSAAISIDNVDAANLFNIIATNDCGSTTYIFQYTPGCFPAGTKVHLANNEIKNIEDVKVGDKVVGAFGELNTVLALQHVYVGGTKMYKLNNEHITTDHHPHVTSTKQFVTIDISTIENAVYGKEMYVIDAEGKTVLRRLDGLKKGRIQKLETGATLKTIDGSRVLVTMEEVSLAPETKLYNLVLDGSHTYHADGYAVTGWPSEQDFDYDTWNPK